MGLIFLLLVFTIIPVTYSQFEVLGGLAPLARIVFMACMWLPLHLVLSLYMRAKCTLELKS